MLNYTSNSFYFIEVIRDFQSDYKTEILKNPPSEKYDLFAVIDYLFIIKLSRETFCCCSFLVW